MAENRAIRRFSRTLDQIKVSVLGFSNATSITDVRATFALLQDEWREFQSLEKSLNGKFDEANAELVDKIETYHFDLKQQLFKFEKMLENQGSVEEGKYTIGDLMLNQSHFLNEISNLTKRETEVRLPRANIPTYSGNYVEFPSFRDLYEASIHNNDNITKVHKLQYLKSLLVGDAYSLINHLATTDANYDEAWDKIKNRYDKPKQVVHNLLKQFVEQPNVKQSCSKSLRHLSDVSDEVIRGLKVLDQRAEERDPWLIFLLIQKLDQESKQAWAHATVDINFPTVDQLLNFLNDRSDALESLSCIQNEKPNNSKRISFFTSQSLDYSCPLCGGDHYLGRCENYLSLSMPERKQTVAEKKLCFNCLGSSHQSPVCRSRYTCKICRRKHHLTLHPENTLVKQPEVEIEDNSCSQSTSTNCNAVVKIDEQQPRISQAILPTANVFIEDKFGKRHKCRILLDSGSQTSFISENCIQNLQLQRHRANVSVTGLTPGSVTSKGKVALIMQSTYNSKIKVPVTALIVNSLPTRLPAYQMQPDDERCFQDILLADPQYHKPAPIDILLGADKVFSILEGGKKQINSIILHETLFGWIVSGQPHIQQEDNSFPYLKLNIQLAIDIDDSLRKFWEIEDLYQHNNRSPEDLVCEEFYTQTHNRQKDGRYIVKLPFKKSSQELGNSLNIAIQRFFTMERKLANNIELQGLYIQQIREYVEMGHMIEVFPTQHNSKDKELFYLPHHSVIKEGNETTKMRIVFDGSSKSTTGVSLNEKLIVGPTIQPTLWSTLMRFRGHRIAVTADIEKMYRQIIVDADDAEYQRVVWREKPNKQIRHYKLSRVTFGLACSAFLAIRTLQQLAYDDADDTIKDHILNDFYVDDFLSGAQDIQEATILKTKLTNILQQGGFSLRKWKSNVTCLSDVTNSATTLELCSDNVSAVKILGLQWWPSDDLLTFKVSQEQDGPVTKRKIISESSRVFDPLGFLSPPTLLLKILFQKLWFLKIDWDDPLPKYFEDEYKRIRGEFKYFEDINISRFTNHYQYIELHGFADASEDAYSAVVYSKVIDESGKGTIHFLTSKTKVAPVKKISLPRLELCAAQLLSKLMFTVRETIKPDAKCYAWTDSSIVLAWLSTYPAKWKTFIANRTSQILDKFPREHWGHVRSADNPADHGSRGVYPKLLANLAQWWNGPEWLIQPESFWPIMQPLSSNSQAELESESNKKNVKTYAFNVTIEESWLDELFTKKSKLKKILRIIAYIQRFIVNLKIKDPTQKQFGELTASEIEQATSTCIKWVQKVQFKDDIENLQRSQRVHNSSKLLPLAPFMDSTGTLRVGGRLFNTDCEYDSKHPILLPSNHVFTERLIWGTHNNNLHAGPTLTNNLVRQRYWILGGRAKIRVMLKKCVVCVKHAHRVSSQLMGNLPAERVTPTLPFTNCGIDFAGPLYFAAKKGRGGTNPIKGYLCIFVCLSIKAVHIEAVSDMTSEAFLAALKRFTARRGIPKNLHTDNGSNFIGARRILNEAYRLIKNINNNYAISEFLSSNRINWHFIPPASPHFGGLWEAAVKSVKTHLLKTVQNVNLTFEEMTTLVCQIENILNSRPLYTSSVDDDYEVLTPAHFLIGTSTGSVPEANLTSQDSSLSRWKGIQSRVQAFWKKYQLDYLNNLQQRGKWQKKNENVKINDIVIVKEDNMPVCKWPLGKIVQIHPGEDNIVRVATIKTSSSTLQRPVVKLCVLPVA